MAGRLAAAALLEQAQRLLVENDRSPRAIEVVGLLLLAAQVRCAGAELVPA